MNHRRSRPGTLSVVIRCGIPCCRRGARSPLSAQTFNIQEHMLKNGMKVLVQEDPSIPNVALYTFFHVGSRNEHEGITGLSHFFEHMMFNGAKKYGPGQFDKAMEGAGGNNNAYTSNDMTVYQDWFPEFAARTDLRSGSGPCAVSRIRSEDRRVGAPGGVFRAAA